MPSRVRVCVFVALLAVVVVPAAVAVEPVNTTFFGNLAIEGYDPVAYFADGAPAKGSKQHQLEWHGANWRFASAEHLEAFRAAPEKYAPQYGGYCAWAVAQNSTAGIDPAAWRIVDDKLYLNYSKDVQQKWVQDIAGNIAAADANWPGLVATK